MSFFDSWVPNTPIYKLLSYVAYGLTNRALKAAPKCPECKTAMEPQPDSQYLFLLPLWDDQSHPDSPEYFVQNMRSIRSEAEIPTGERACRVCVFLCPNCHQRVVQIDDYLKVRAEKVVYGQYVYEYEPFARMLMQSTSEQLSSQR